MLSRGGVGARARPALPRRRALLLAVLVVLLLHGAALNGVAWSWHRPIELPNTAAMQVRTLPPEPPPPTPKPAAAAPRPVPKRVVAPVPPPVPGPPEPPAPIALASPLQTEVPPPAPPPEPVPAAEPMPSPPVPPLVALPDVPAAAAPIAEAASAPPVAADRAQVPPAITIGYELRRGLLRGTAELHWLARDGEYELIFDARVAGFSLLKQTSSGDWDDTGLAPLRFTDQRSGREQRATNFQRELGEITFSGPTTEFPLVAGTQDRLSWMVQLAAIVAADPKRREPGGQVAMAVVGSRADLAAWVFRYTGDEAVVTALGTVNAAKFVRERRDAYDTNVEVWLDPARWFLPARAVLRSGPDDDGIELLLRRASGQP